MINVWPKRDIALPPKAVWKHAFNENEGFGKRYDDTSYFETWQYGSFRVILSRLRRSRYRTYNISEASLFFIPYDAGSECYVDDKGMYRDKGNPLAPAAFAELTKYPTLLRNRGHDHFFIHAVTMVAHRNSIRLKELYEYMWNATILTVEVLPIVHQYLRRLPYIQSIPMVSMYHWQRAEKKKSLPALRVLNSKRSTLISYYASASTGCFSLYKVYQMFSIVT